MMNRIFIAFKYLIGITGIAVIYFIAKLLDIDIGETVINPEGNE